MLVSRHRLGLVSALFVASLSACGGQVLEDRDAGPVDAGTDLSWWRPEEHLGECCSVQGGTMSTGRSSYGAALLPTGKVLIAGGASSFTPLASAEVFDPGTGKFTATGSLLGPRADLSMTALPSGKVLVAGGSNSVSFAGAAELYDPVAGTFTATGSLVQPRAGAPAALLASGKVLVAGGFGNSVSAMNTAELYAPSTGKFASISSMATARDRMTLTVLASGKVLAAGGSVATAELLDLQVGTSCTAQQADNCVSGICKNGICCAKDCGPCNTCAAGTGACVPIVSGDDGTVCTGTSTCSAGVCKAKTGQACSGDGSTCLSGFCADGVCCDAACNGGCDVCNVPGKEGTCTVATKGTAGTAPSCAPYVCDGKANACPTTCATLADCADGARCDAVSHTCVTGATCNDHVTTDVNGVTADCAPFKVRAQRHVPDEVQVRRRLRGSLGLQRDGRLRFLYAFEPGFLERRMYE